MLVPRGRERPRLSPPRLRLLTALSRKQNVTERVEGHGPLSTASDAGGGGGSGCHKVSGCRTAGPRLELAQGFGQG